MRLVRDFVEIGDCLPLDEMIRRLAEAREMLPPGAMEPEVRMTGDDVFGRRLCISFLRPHTAEEIAREARYADAYRACAGWPSCRPRSRPRPGPII
jgi:hypothetical protein